MKISSLKDLRVARGMKQLDVVAATDGRISQPKLSGIERGITPSSPKNLLETVADLSAALRVVMSVEDFLKLQMGITVEVLEVADARVSA